jgi:dihydrofolate synthase / folylpolyglutamate synthase
VPRSSRRADLFERLFALELAGIKLGLENISRLCEALGHPERQFRTIHIAGTNGKGSVTAMVHAALLAAGVRAARYTSPHLTDLTERFVVGADPVDGPGLEAVVDDVLDCADRLRATGTLTVAPTFFEATTAAAFELFRREGIEVAVFEVGLGGRFDATNVLRPAAAAITSIGLDHQQHLGDTIAAIAFEKAGIIKPGLTVVAGALPPEARALIGRTASERGARLVPADAGTIVDCEMIDGRARLQVQTPRDAYGPVDLSLRGEHQVGNALVAIRLLEIIRDAGVPVPRAAVEAGLARAEWPGRLEPLALPEGRRVLLDAAHNPEGALALAGYLRRWHRDRPVLVAGVMRDKDATGILAALLPVSAAMVATRPPSPRAMAAEDLAGRAIDVATRLGVACPIDVESDAETAVGRAFERGPDVCVAGSLFLVGAVRDGLRRRAILP